MSSIKALVFKIFKDSLMKAFFFCLCRIILNFDYFALFDLSFVKFFKSLIEVEENVNVPLFFIILNLIFTLLRPIKDVI